MTSPVDVLTLALLGFAALLVVVHAEGCGRFLLRGEDPRTMAAFRIACGLCTIGWTLDLWPLRDYLFSDEGLFLTDTARQVFTPSAFAGIADGSAEGEVAGPLDGVALVQFIASPRHSLLFFFDDPGFVHLHVFVLLGAAVCFTLGLLNAVTKWITLLALHSLLTRNAVFWAGEQVFCNFLFLLCLSRCGRAWSVDAWVRARLGHVPADSTIPAWPRALALLQMIPMFTANGLAKTGELWAAGDTFHYLLMHPDFQRFDASMLARLGSTTVLRFMTWGAHVFELLFPLAIVGVVLRSQRGAALAPLTGRGAVAARVAWVGAAVAVAALTVLTLEGRERSTLCFVVPIAASVCVAIVALSRGRLRAPRVAGTVLGRSWLLRWPLGRRVWATLLVAFTGSLLVFASLGWFVVLTLGTTLLLFEGEELGRLVTRLRGRASEVRATPEAVDEVGPAGFDPMPAAALVVLAVGASVAYASASSTVWTTTLIAVGAGTAFWARRRIAACSRAGVRISRHRFMVGWFCAFHVAAVAVVLLPKVDSRDRQIDDVARGRVAIEAPLRGWLAYAYAEQTWRMFAPNGARVVASLEVEVTTVGGEATALGAGLPAAGGGILRLGEDKLEKIERRLAHGEGQGQWYQKWHGRYVCRSRALHSGQLPEEVTLWLVTRPIASPEEYAAADPSTASRVEGEGETREVAWQKRCIHEVQAQPPDSSTFVPWIKRRAEKWSEARARGEMPELPWSLAILFVPWLVLRLPHRRSR